MKTISLEKPNLNAWMKDLQSEKVIVTQDGRPLALVVGVAGLDQEQVELGSSEEFWKLMAKRRKEKTLSRAEVEQELKRRSLRRRANKAKLNGRK